MSKSSLLLTTDRLILRSPVESDTLELKAFDERNANTEFNFLAHQLEF